MTDVIVLNSHGVGQYAYCDRMPEWGESLAVKKWHVAQDGGKGSNVACALGRLGSKTAYIGKVGNDPWGDLGEKWMGDAGVNTTYMYRSDDISTGTGLVLIGPNGENSIIDGEGSSVALTFEEITNAIDALSDARMFVTGLEIPEKLALDGAKYAKSKGMKVAFNPSPLPETDMGMLSYIDYLFINEVEGKFILDINKETDIEPEKIARMVKEKYGCGNIVLTIGGDGSCAVDENDEFFFVSSTKVENIVNTAGAGDGFMAATVHKLLAGENLAQAMAFASKYAALSITIDGTIPAYRPLEEVEAFIVVHS